MRQLNIPQPDRFIHTQNTLCLSLSLFHSFLELALSLSPSLFLAAAFGQFSKTIKANDGNKTRAKRQNKLKPNQFVRIANVVTVLANYSNEFILL